MIQKDSENVVTREIKEKLGKEIIKCRGEMSQRKLAKAVGLPPSNMKYIEDGVNAPSYKVYAKIIDVLNPTRKQLALMDKLYSKIRKSPPPDVCKIINNNPELFDSFRVLEGQILSKMQITKAKELFESFVFENIKGSN